MLLSFSCSAIGSLHGLCTVRVVSVKQSLMNGIAAQCTVYHVWLPSIGMAEKVRPDIGSCAGTLTADGAYSVDPNRVRVDDNIS